MSFSNEKIEKLVAIARLYYDENKNQNEIAQLMGISRPLVSRYLSEAKDCGIVNIQIQNPLMDNQLILDKLQKRFGLRGGLVVETKTHVVDTNRAIAEAVAEGLLPIANMSIGVGWGSIMGNIVTKLEQKPILNLNTKVYPLVAGSGVFNRAYHTNEIVRMFAEKTGGKAVSWYAPAFVDSPQEMKRMKELDNYREILNGWKSIRVAFVNIGNYPSVPDFATAASYGNRLVEEKAVGKLLSYYYDINGHIIKPETDFMMQIPIEILSKRKYVIGICAANVGPKAAMGALKTGIFTHIIASKDTVKELV